LGFFTAIAGDVGFEDRYLHLAEADPG